MTTGILLADLLIIWGGLLALILLALIVAARPSADRRDMRQGRADSLPPAGSRPPLTLVLPLHQERAARAQLHPRLYLIDCSPMSTPFDHENAPAQCDLPGA